jgi:hypothetical protein
MRLPKTTRIQRSNTAEESLRITLLCATREKENHQPLAKNTFSTLGLLLGLCGRTLNHMIQTSTTRKLRNYLPTKKSKKIQKISKETSAEHSRQRSTRRPWAGIAMLTSIN